MGCTFGPLNLIFGFILFLGFYLEVLLVIWLVPSS
jgi:hypothetical protein